MWWENCETSSVPGWHWTSRQASSSLGSRWHSPLWHLGRKEIASKRFHPRQTFQSLRTERAKTFYTLTMRVAYLRLSFPPRANNDINMLTVYFIAARRQEKYLWFKVGIRPNWILFSWIKNKTLNYGNAVNWFYEIIFLLSGCAAVGQGLVLIIEPPAAPPAVPGDRKGEGAAATEGADIIVWCGPETNKVHPRSILLSHDIFSFC